MASTPRWGLRYPLGADAPDVPLWMQRLATDLDGVAMDDQGLLADRPVSTPAAPGKRGRYYYATDAGALYRDTGTSWEQIPIGVGQATTVGDYKYGVQAASHGTRADGLFAWVLADGSELAAGYTGLIATLNGASNPFGVGAAGRPKVPDLRGRVPVMPDGAAGRLGANDTLGGSGGEERHTLDVAEMPAHDHDIGGGSISATYVADTGTWALGYGGASAFGKSGDGATEGIKNAGGGGSHNNMQPFLVGGHWFLHAGSKA